MKTKAASSFGRTSPSNPGFNVLACHPKFKLNDMCREEKKNRSFCCLHCSVNSSKEEQNRGAQENLFLNCPSKENIPLSCKELQKIQVLT
jgi:hypothetical protein